MHSAYIVSRCYLRFKLDKACLKRNTTRFHFWRFGGENFTMDAMRLRDAKLKVFAMFTCTVKHAGVFKLLY